MKRAVFLLLLAPALALGQGVQYEPRLGGGSGNVFAPYPGRVSPAAGLSSAGAASHIYWDGARLRDVRGLTWTQNGTVPQVTGLAGFSRARNGAGPFSAANYYTSPTAMRDAVIGWGAGFMQCMIVNPTTSGYAVLASVSAGSDGYELAISGDANARLVDFAGSKVVLTYDGIFTLGSPNLVCWGHAGTTTYVQLNGGTVWSTGASPITATTAQQTIGSRSGSYPLNGVMVELWTSAQAWDAGVAAAQYARFVARRNTAIQVACIGDSLTAGGYPSDLGSLLGPGYAVTNFGVSGYTSAQVQARWLSDVRGRGYKWLVYLAGTNDIGNDLPSASGSAEAAWANLATTIGQAKTDGLSTVVMTLSPRAAVDWNGTRQTELLQLNSFITGANDGGYSVGSVVDLYPGMGDSGSDAGLDGTYLKPEYSADGLHWNAAGRAYVAGRVKAVISP